MHYPRLAHVAIAAYFATVFATPSSAITINYSTVIGPGSPFENQEVTVIDGVDGPSHVVIQPGVSLSSLLIGDSSTAIVRGGNIDNGLTLVGNASLTMVDGSVGNVFGGGNVKAQILGGIVRNAVAFSTSRHTPGSPGLLIAGGKIKSQVVVEGGKLLVTGGDLDFVLARYGTLAEISGGDMLRLQVMDESVAHYSGGTLNKNIALGVGDSSAIHIYGENLSYNERQRTLNGTLSDGTVMVDYQTDGPASGFILHNVPEPSTLPLGVVAIALLILSRVRTRLAHVAIAVFLAAVFAGPSSAATINYSTVIGPGSPFENQDVEIMDGVEGPSHVVIQPGASLTGLFIDGNSTAIVRGGIIDNGVILSAKSSVTLVDGTVRLSLV